MGIECGSDRPGTKVPKDPMVKRWKQLIAQTQRALQKFESGEMHTFLGPGTGPEHDVSATEAQRARETIAVLQRLVDEYSGF